MLLDRIEQTIRSRRTNVAYVHGTDALTYAELDRRADQVAGELRSLGLEAGNRVAVKAEACVACPAVFIGIWRAGGVVVPLDPAIGPGDLAYCLNVSQARYLAAPIRSDDPSSTRRFEVQPVATYNHGWPDRSHENDFLIWFTSGTTGTPKGMVHTQLSLGESTQNYLDHSDFNGEDVVAATSLFSTAMGVLSYIFFPLLVGAKVVIVQPFLPRVALNAMLEQGVTWLHTSPAVLKLLAVAAPRPTLPRLRVVRTAGATLDAKSIDEFVAVFGIEPVIAYGMSEIGGSIASTRRLRGPRSERAVGHPVVNVRIFDDKGGLAPAGAVGEIGVLSPSLCRPWYLLEDGAREPLPMHGEYFLTGDLGRLSEDGTLELAGRRKAFILTPRYKVDPHEVEQVLCGHPAVAEAAVVPAPGHAGYEIVKAVVVAANPVSSTELLAYCEERLPMGKRPQIVTFLDRLPRNALGKIKIGELIAAP